MKVLFVDTVHPVLSEDLSQANLECIHMEEASIEECLAELKNCDGLVIRSKFPVNEKLLRECPNLKFIARSGAGMENIDVSYCLSRGITLYNSPEGNRNAVGEHTLGLLLNIMNNISTAHLQIKKGVWERENNRGEELDSKTVGIIGYGHNGSAFAKKLKGFDVKVLAYDKYKEGYGDNFVMESTLEAIYQNADIISFHVPQNSETEYYFNEQFIDHCHKPIYLLNVSRGKIVSTSALIKGLQTGQVKAAGLDVNEFEKSSFENFFENTLHPELDFILSSEKIVLTSHIAGWTKESYFLLSKVLSDKILADYSH